jgi:hypothetical protein
VITGHSWNIKYTDHSAVVIDKLIQKTKQTESKANADLIVHNGAKKRPWERGCTNHTAISFPEPAILGKETKALG